MAAKKKKYEPDTEECLFDDAICAAAQRLKSELGYMSKRTKKLDLASITGDDLKHAAKMTISTWTKERGKQAGTLAIIDEKKERNRMIDPTDKEREAFEKAIEPLKETLREIGFDVPPIQWQKQQVLTIVETIYTGITDYLIKNDALQFYMKGEFMDDDIPF